MPVYSVQTDAFLADEIEADSLDDAIADAFEDEIPSIVDRASLERKFALYAADGGWCVVEEDGEVVIEIGDQ